MLYMQNWKNLGSYCEPWAMLRPVFQTPEHHFKGPSWPDLLPQSHLPTPHLFPLLLVQDTPGPNLSVLLPGMSLLPACLENAGSSSDSGLKDTLPQETFQTLA